MSVSASSAVVFFCLRVAVVVLFIPHYVFVSRHPSLSTFALLCRFTTVSFFFFSAEIRGSVGSSLVTLPLPVLFSLSKSDLCVSSRRLCSLLWSSQFVFFLHQD